MAREVRPADGCSLAGCRLVPRACPLLAPCLLPAPWLLPAACRLLACALLQHHRVRSPAACALPPSPAQQIHGIVRRQRLETAAGDSDEPAPVPRGISIQVAQPAEPKPLPPSRCCGS